jgi:hypothetical protein
MKRAATTAIRPTVLGAASDLPPAVALAPAAPVVVPLVPPVLELAEVPAGTTVLAPAASFLYSASDRVEFAAVLSPVSLCVQWVRHIPRRYELTSR